MTDPVLFAVATKEGLVISEHFGHAKQFTIYKVTPDSCTLLETRQVEHYCLGNSSSKTAMAGILETIKDCHSVFVAKIGLGPTDKLAAIGVKSVSDYAWEDIEPSLIAYRNSPEFEA